MKRFESFGERRNFRPLRSAQPFRRSRSSFPRPGGPGALRHPLPGRPATSATQAIRPPGDLDRSTMPATQPFAASCGDCWGTYVASRRPADLNRRVAVWRGGCLLRGWRAAPGGWWAVDSRLRGPGGPADRSRRRSREGVVGRGVRRRMGALGVTGLLLVALVGEGSCDEVLTAAG